MVMVALPVLAGTRPVAGEAGNCWRPLVRRSRWRGGRTGSRAARIRELAMPAAAASTAAEAFADARVWVIERTASRRAVVNDTRAGVAGAFGSLPGAAVRQAAAPAWIAWQPWMRTSWVAVIQAHISWVTWCGDDERRIGPREGPASVIADLSSPMTVSTAAHRSG